MRTPPPPRIVWDWNGTLFDDAGVSLETLNLMLARRRRPPIGLDAYRETFGFPVKGFYRRSGFDLEREDWDAICVEFHDLYATGAARGRLREGAEEALAHFRALGVPMHVLSASEQSLLERMVRSRGIAGYFRSLHGVDNLHGHSKERIGAELVAAHAAEGPGVLLVGDTTHDHEVARALGWDCVLMEGGHQSLARLRACGRPVVPDMPALVAFVDRRLGAAAGAPRPGKR
jgi:phosphoglycolate phosphatase